MQSLRQECVIETKANSILDFIHGLRGELQVTFEEGTWATWLYDLLKPYVTKLVVCDPRKNSRQGNKNDRIDARKLSDRLYMRKNPLHLTKESSLMHLGLQSPAL
jgi:hypothetical protein